MGDTFVSRTGRKMPMPTRKRYYTPARIVERRALNDRRLREARNHFHAVRLRLVPQVRMCPERPDQYGALQGEAFRVLLPEAIDVWDLLRDVERFMRSWRPMRTRTSAGQQATARWLDAWERLGVDGRNP